MIPEAREVHLSRKDRKVLEACCRSPMALQRDLKRARIVLLAQISVSLEEAEVVLNAETAKRLTLQRGREGTDERIEAARSTLRQHSDLWSADQGLLIDLDFEQATAERRSKELAERIAGERASLDDARLTRDALREAEARETEARASTNARLDALAAERAGLTGRWIKAGQTGEPDAARLAQHRSRVTERVARLEPIRATHSQLVSGYRKWLNDEQLGKLERERLPPKFKRRMRNLRWLLTGSSRSARTMRAVSLSWLRRRARGSTRSGARCRNVPRPMPTMSSCR
jgi:hypothetical protein